MSRDVHSCTHWLTEAPQFLPPPAFGLVLRGRYWSAKIDDISLQPPASRPWNNKKDEYHVFCYRMNWVHACPSLASVQANREKKSKSEGTDLLESIDRFIQNQSSTHGVYRVPGFLSSRRNWVPPLPASSPASECCSPSLGPRGDTLTGERGGGTDSDEGTDTLVLMFPIIHLRFDYILPPPPTPYQQLVSLFQSSCVVVIATVLGSIPVSSDAVESQGGRWSSVEYRT